MRPSRGFLEELYRVAVAAAHPANCLAPQLRIRRRTAG